MLGFTQVLDCQLDSPSTRERPPDIAGHAATKALIAIVDLNERTLTFSSSWRRLSYRDYSKEAGFAALLRRYIGSKLRVDAEDHDFHSVSGARAQSAELRKKNRRKHQLR